MKEGAVPLQGEGMLYSLVHIFQGELVSVAQIINCMPGGKV